MTRSVAAVVVLVLATVVSAQAQKPVVALLPLSNVSGAVEASAPVEQAIRERLEKRGWTVAPAEEVERFLEEQRIRYLDSLPPATLQALREKVGAGAVVVGSILAYDDGSNPGVALAARMLDAEGRVVWGDVAALTASETEGAFGFGKLTKADALVREVAGRLVSGVPKPGQTRKPGLEAGFFARGAATYRSGAHPRGQVVRVCILPFTAKVPAAARVLVELLTIRLEATGEFDVVEPAEFREAMRAAKLASVASITSKELGALSEPLQTTVFLRGNVHTWREGAGGRTEIQFDMTLVDVESGEILWAVTHQRRGADYAGAFQRGAVDNIVTLADRALSEAIAEQHRARPRQPRSRLQEREVRKER